MHSKDSLNHVLSLLIIAGIILSSLHFMRFISSPYLPLYDQYESFSFYRGEPQKWHITLIGSLANSSYNPVFIMRILPFLAGLFSTVLGYLLLESIIEEQRRIFFTILLWIMSPVFIYLFGTYNPVFLPLTILILSFFLLIKERYILGLAGLLTAFLINPNSFPVIFMFLILIQWRNKKYIIPVIGIIISSYLFITFTSLPIPSGVPLLNLFSPFISDLGSSYGMGIFNIFLAFIGIIISWKQKHNYGIAYACLIALFILSVYNAEFIPATDITLVFFSGLAFTRLWNRKWESQILKNYFLILVLCGFIFSTVAYINGLANAGPSHSEIISLNWLKNNNNGKAVLSHHEYGFLIKGLSGLDTYTDKRYDLKSRDKIRIKQATETFMSRSLTEITDFFEKQGLGYIWINEKMKSGQVWKSENEGMLLILHNSVNFRKVYDYGGVEIWEFYQR